MDPQVSQPAVPEQPSGAPESGLSLPELVAGQAAPPPAAVPPPGAQFPAVDPASAAGTPDPEPPKAAPTGPNPLSSSSYDGPLIASDVDVIEKEWVDKADTEVKRTAGDPYAEEEAVENLQIDYLKKRYGKDIRKSEDS